MDFGFVSVWLTFHFGFSLPCSVLCRTCHYQTRGVHDFCCACWSCVILSVVLLLDPMNALTNLTGVGGGPGAIGMGPRPTGAPVGGMGAMGQMQIGQHAMAGVPGNPQASECVSSMWCVFAVQAHLQSVQWMLAASKLHILASEPILFSVFALARCVCVCFTPFPPRRVRCWSGASDYSGTSSLLPAGKSGSRVTPTVCWSRKKNR